MALLDLIGRLYIKFRMLLRTGLRIMAEVMVPHDIKLIVNLLYLGKREEWFLAQLGEGLDSHQKKKKRRRP